MRRTKSLYPPPYYYFKDFLQNHRFAKIGWIKLGNLTGLYAGGRKKAPSRRTPGGGFLFGESKWNLCISTFSICEIQKKSSLPQENYILRPKLKLKCIPILAVVLIAYPENRLIGQIVDHAVDGVGVGVVVVPGAAAHRSQQVDVYKRQV